MKEVTRLVMLQMVRDFLKRASPSKKTLLYTFRCVSMVYYLFMQIDILSDAVCTVHHLTGCIYTNKMHKILVIRLYFLLDAVHVSDYISPSSGATL